MSSPINTLITNLEQLDQANVVNSAIYREQAQNVLANPKIALKMRLKIAELLSEANQYLMLHTVKTDDSY